MNPNLAPCGPGNVAFLAVDNTDCACVSIASITNNQPIAQSFTITLSNGQSITLPLIQGASGTIAMRVYGTPAYIQYSSNGGVYQNLIAISAITGPAGASGTSLIWSDAANHAAPGGNVVTVLSSFNTNNANPAQNLVNVGDVIRLYVNVQLASTPIAALVLFGVEFIINGTGLSNIGLFSQIAIDSATAQIELFTDIILTSNTAGAMTARVISRAIVSKSAGGSFFQYGEYSATQDIGGATCDFSANNYAISVQVENDSSTGGIGKYFSAEKLTY